MNVTLWDVWQITFSKGAHRYLLSHVLFCNVTLPFSRDVLSPRAQQDRCGIDDKGLTSSCVAGWGGRVESKVRVGSEKYDGFFLIRPRVQ